MFNTIVGAGAASRYGSGSDQKMRLLAAPAPQHWLLSTVDRWSNTHIDDECAGGGGYVLQGGYVGLVLEVGGLENVVLGLKHTEDL
jgi:hypothetical protein